MSSSSSSAHLFFIVSECVQKWNCEKLLIMSSSNQKSKLIAEQINKLLDAHSKNFKKESDMSPMVHKLVKNEVQERNVMLLKRLFEHTGHVVANKEEIEK